MYRDALKGWIKHIDFLIIDIVCLEVSFLIVYTLRNDMRVAPLPQLYRDLVTVIILIDICTVFFRSSYKDIIRRGYLVELRETMLHCAFVTAGVIIWMFVIKQSADYSRIIVLGMYPVSVCICYFSRLAWKRMIRIRIREGKRLRKLMVISSAERIRGIIDGLLYPYRDYSVEAIALFDGSKTAEKDIRGIPVVADREGVLPYIQEHIIDEVFIDLPDNEKSEEQLMNQIVGMGVTVHINLLCYGSSMENKRIYSLGRYMVVSSTMRFAEPWQMFIKRVMDICGALVGLVITGVAFLIFAPVIYRQSPGPFFFSQERIGRNGRVFKIYKFRTMYPDAESKQHELMKYNKMNGLMFKMDNDPRIIPIGHFLREKSIDELPQFWNILKGDMSLVGTRPPTVDEYNHYGINHKKRLAMKPGLTGLWQVSGRSDIVDFDEVVALDSKYITEWTLTMDIKIIWKTLLTVWKGKGAV